MNDLDLNMDVEIDGTPPKPADVLLIGNGFNRCFGKSSWEQLLAEIKTADLSEEDLATLKTVPAPLQAVILTGDTVDKSMKKISQSLTEMTPCEEEKALIDLLRDSHFDAILTTNYTYELEKTFRPGFKIKPGTRCRHRKKAADGEKPDIIQRLYTYFDVLEDKPIWHIHGEAAKPDSMILGHYYYGKMIARIHEYLQKLIPRYKYCQKQRIPMKYYSWVDYFLTGNVVILGLGLDLSEIDLWWLINCKKKNFPETTVALYSTGIDKNKRMLAETYGVIVKDTPVNGDYLSYYKSVLKEWN